MSPQCLTPVPERNESVTFAFATAVANPVHDFQYIDFHDIFLLFIVFLLLVGSIWIVDGNKVCNVRATVVAMTRVDDSILFISIVFGAKVGIPRNRSCPTVKALVH